VRGQIPGEVGKTTREEEGGGSERKEARRDMDGRAPGGGVVETQQPGQKS
jgi:hypothetical protein